MKKSSPRRGYYDPSPPISAKAETNDEQHRQSRGNKSNTKTITHVSVEEWDCPRPGVKKYMPKEVKQNIRKNMKRINSGEQQNEADSVRTSSRKDLQKR
ncbi:MAG TPA: hypothetical protein VIN08_27115 [Ohtaekwangia sp.]|uniref:hypothetical protein n=1 Tax=Ohtaekwangia sp. TaxID=2066019 RepID=UPI002F95F0C3